jgi:alkaline phosphatase D
VAARTQTRRIPLALLAALLATLPATASAEASAKGFQYGVAAGDVTSDSAILWAKAGRTGKAHVQVVKSGGFGRCNVAGAARQRVARAKGSHDKTIRKRVKNLSPDTAYSYRFCMSGGAHSETGKFRTAPGAGDRKSIEFALTGDQDARPAPGESQPYWNEFEVWDRIRRERNDFNVLLGDTIYSDTEVPGYTADDVALTRKEKWRVYKLNLGLRPWPKARGSAAYYAHWDDHEFINDFSVGEDSFPLGVGTVNIDGETLYERSWKAFRDYNPITFSRERGIYRTVRWGKNLEVFFLDERSFRSNSVDYTDACDNPPGSGNPDLAPTLPQSFRDLFSLFVPALADPPPPGCVAALEDPSRTMLGADQLERFKRQVARSDATFKVIFNEVPIQQFYSPNVYDRWEGYEAERQEVLRYLQKNVANVVFMSTDFHANMVNDARFDTLGPGGVQNSGILDITTGPVATRTYSQQLNEGVDPPNPAVGPLVQSVFLKPEPPAGVGMQCAATDQFSYAQVRVTKGEVTVDLLDANRQPVIDTGDIAAPDGAPPCSRIVIPKQ